MAGGAPCSWSALVDLWDSGLPPAYPIPVPDRVTPTYETSYRPPPAGSLTGGLLRSLNPGGGEGRRATYSPRTRGELPMGRILAFALLAAVVLVASATASIVTAGKAVAYPS